MMGAERDGMGSVDVLDMQQLQHLSLASALHFIHLEISKYNLYG